MAYTLDKMASEMKAVLNKGAGPAELEATRQLVAKALKDEEFVETHLGKNAQGERNILYEDPDLGFCILAHVYKGAKTSKPHDHGPGWAIYGQAFGETNMKDYQIVEKGSGEKPTKVKETKVYKLTPGDARVYQVGDVHCPFRESETRLIRIESQNMDRVERTKIELA
ncbi:MAG: hypothetical protein VW268_09235 [Rhodospirillaceae bacterium]